MLQCDIYATVSRIKKQAARYKHKFLEKIGQFYRKTGQKKGKKEVKKG